ncbi:MAG: hypothetical protein ACXWK5_03195 [Myxococcaceae bacterium]
MTRVTSPFLRFSLVALGLGIAACASGAMSSAARNALAASSNCPVDRVTVEDLGGSRYRASGCEKTETYRCMTPGQTVVSCLPESSTTPSPETQR